MIRYGSDSLEYLGLEEGFGGVAVRGIVEDAAGNIWFGTERGLTKYDLTKSDQTGATFFTNFTEKDGLPHNDIWAVTIDSKGIVWVGTLQGACYFDPFNKAWENGKLFTPFELPETEPDFSRGVTSSKIVHSITEDSQGKMWFGTNGGAYIFSPSTALRTGSDSFWDISEKDGLPSNSVNDILEDRNGNIWLATHHKGVSQYNPATKEFQNFTADGTIEGNEVWSLFEDRKGNIWFPAEGFGVYRYNPLTDEFTNFGQKKRLGKHCHPVHFEDVEGRIWLGGWMGLFRYDAAAGGAGGERFFRVLDSGPWR